MEKDVDTKAQAAVINTTNVTAPLPIVVKIELPRDAEKQKKNKAADDGEADAKKATKSRLCQLLPVLVFLATFATVLTLLIIYLDPTSTFATFFFYFLRSVRSFAGRLSSIHDDYDQLELLSIQTKQFGQSERCPRNAGLMNAPCGAGKWLINVNFR